MAAIPTFTPTSISANEERGAVTLWYQCAVECEVGQAAYLDSNDQLNPAIATSAAASRAAGVITNSQGSQYGETTIPAGGWAQLTVGGPVQGFTGLTPGNQLWVSKTVAGGLDTAAPTAAYDWIIGQVVAEDTIFVRPGMTTPVSA